MKCTPENADDLERYFYTTDEQGSTTLITSTTANICNEYFYDDFGNVLDGREEVHNRITYTGQQFDSVTQQYYLRARFYNPVIGRFTQEDVYRGDGLNLYAYCRDNPVVYYDPSGYEGCPSKERQIAEEGSKATWKKISKELTDKATDVSSWSKGSFDSAQDSLAYHFDKHASEVGATSVEQYMRKAEGFMQSLRGAKKYGVDGAVEGTTTIEQALQDTIEYFLDMINEKQSLNEEDFECSDSFDF